MYNRAYENNTICNSQTGYPIISISILNRQNAHTRILNSADTGILSAPVSEVTPQCLSMSLKGVRPLT